ncbi:MAG: phytoene dehydrogenase-like protein [Paraglaciecola sp.]
MVGGAAVTEGFYLGFRNSVASYTVSLLSPKVINDLQLHQYGLKIVHRKVNNLWPHDNGDFFAFVVGSDNLKAEIARFSKTDADALNRYFRDTSMVADIIRNFLLDPPPMLAVGPEIFLKPRNLVIAC